MSQWTHVNFVAELRWHECSSKTELREQVEQELEGVEDYISGSEGGVDWYINVPSRHGSVLLANENSTYFWNTVYLTCAGHLRDRTKKETEKEIKYFIEHKLKQDFLGVRNITYKVYGDGEELDFWKGDKQ